MAATNTNRRKSGSKKRSRPKSRGHWCWACDRFLANERFSGRGHSRHLCRQCANLGAPELTFRSAASNLERCLSESGFVRRKHRKTVQRFLNHADLRLRAWAEELLSGVPVGDHIVELTEEEFADQRLLEEEFAEGELPRSDADAIDWFDDYQTYLEWGTDLDD